MVYGGEQEFTTEEEYFDETLLFGKWVSGSLFYRYDSDGTGVTWDSDDGVDEDAAASFIWELQQSKLTHGYHLEVGGTIFREYTITKLTVTKLEYKNDSGNQFFFSKVNESL